MKLKNKILPSIGWTKLFRFQICSNTCLNVDDHHNVFFFFSRENERAEVGSESVRKENEKEVEKWE